MLNNRKWLASIKAFGIHFAFSSLLIGIVAFVVFGIWFPFPFASMAGGWSLFWILVVVDLVCGPILTAILFKPKKLRRELVIDLSLVVFLQLAAMFYGIYMIAQARPVHLVFEVDRFVVVSAADIDRPKLENAKPEYRHLSWMGPSLIGARQSESNAELVESIRLSELGYEPSARPEWWQNYKLNKQQVQQRMRKVSSLKFLSPSANKDIEIITKKNHLKEDDIYYLPLVSKKILEEWIVLLDKDAQVVGYASVNGFDQL